jgi:hypothetical protein
MKNLALLLAIVFVGAITASAQSLFTQKISLGLGEPNNAPSVLTAHEDTLLLLGGAEKAVFWVNNNEGIIPTTGLEDLNLDVNQQKSSVYFNHQWWVGIGSVNTEQKYLLSTTGEQASWTSPFAIDSPVNDVFVHDGLLYVVGAFNTVDGQVVNHIFTVDSLNNVTKVGSNGHQQKIVTGLVLNDDLYIIDYVPFANQRTLWRFRNEWSQINLGFDYTCIGGDITVDQSGKLVISGIFFDGNADWYDGLIKYDIASDSIVFKLDDCLGIFYVNSWNDLIFFSGPISEIEGQTVAACDLNFLDAENLNHHYSDNGCIGYLPGIPFLGHYATIGSMQGNGLSDIYVVDTVPFTLTGILEPYTNLQSLKLYPNPATSMITVEVSAKGQIHVLNTLGQEVISPIVDVSSKVDLNVSNLPTGIYTIMVLSKNIRSVGRFEKIE